MNSMGVILLRSPHPLHPQSSTVHKFMIFVQNLDGSIVFQAATSVVLLVVVVVVVGRVEMIVPQTLSIQTLISMIFTHIYF